MSRVVIGDATGALGAVPATSWEWTAELDRAGEISWSMPTDAATIGLVQQRRTARYYDEVAGTRQQLGAGRIGKIGARPRTESSTLEVSGDDAMIALDDLSVGFQSFKNATSAAAVIQLMTYAPAGWTIDTTTYRSTGNTHSSTTVDNVTNVSNFVIGGPIAGGSIPANTTIVDIVGTTITLSAPATATASGVVLSGTSVTNDFAGESLLDALGKVAETVGEHFRLSSTPNQIDWLYRQQPATDIVAGTGAKATCMITSLTWDEDSHDIVTRLYPFGQGNADARVTLKGTTRAGATATGSGAVDYAAGDYVLHIDYTDGRKSYISHPAAETQYGRIERHQSFKDVTDPDVLFDQGREWLRQHIAPQQSYSLEVVGLNQVVLPGVTMRVIYREEVDATPTLSLDKTVVVQAPTVRIDKTGVQTVALKVATIDRMPTMNSSAVETAISTLQSIDRRVQKAAISDYALNLGPPPATAGTGYSVRATATTGATTAATTWTNQVLTVSDVAGTIVSSNRLNVPATGRYSIVANVSFPASATGVRGVRLRLNGNNALILAEEMRPNAGAGDATVITLEMPPTLFTAGDFIHLQVYTGTAALTIDVNSFSPVASLTFLGTN